MSRIRKIIADRFVFSDKFSSDAPLAEWGAGPIDILNALEEELREEEFGIKIPENDCLQFTTVNEIVRYLNQRIKEKTT